MPSNHARPRRTAQQTAMRLFGRIHTALYRLSAGQVWSTTGGMPVLLLTTIGRKTGRPRTLPLGYFCDHNRVLVVADALGQATHPAWYLNLQTIPRVQVQQGSTTSAMVASTITGDERAAIWGRLVQAHPHYGEHQRRTTRELPLVLLRPTETNEPDHGVAR